MTAASDGDLAAVTALLDVNPELVHARSEPYGWTPLHAAAHAGQLAVVELLLQRGADVNARDDGDRTYPMHWAAAAGHLDVVRRLANAGGDVVGAGDDHELEVIGWASCWSGCDDDAHRAIVDFLVERGARHHIFSAIANNRADEVREIVERNPSALETRMSRNELHQRPLHFAVRRNQPAMASLLIDLGADPLGTDDSGYHAAAYATTADADASVMETLRSRGQADLLVWLALREWSRAEQLLAGDEHPWERGGAGFGALHVMAKRGDIVAVEWLLAHGAPPNALWPHWDAEVTPLHLAVLGNHADVVQRLLDAGADPAIRDTKHDSNAADWARFFEREAITRMLDQR